MKVRNKEKMNTVAYCEKVLKEAEKQAEVESIGLIDKFVSFRKKQFKDKADAKDHFDYASFKKKLYVEIDQLEDNLMDVELKLQESLSGATADLQDRVKKVTDDMKAKTSSYILDVNGEMDQFAVLLKQYAL